MKFEPKPIITKPQSEAIRFMADEDLARKIVRSGLQNDAFLLANEDQLTKNCAKLAKHFAGIQPLFDVSCNTCPWLLNTLQHLDFQFSCQSRPEFQHVLAQGIDPSRITFSNTSKIASHMKAAFKNGIDLMVFDSLHELNKIQKAAPNARLLLKLQSPEWQDLLVAAGDLGLNVVGVDLAHNDGQIDFKLMALARMAFAIGRSLGHEMSIVNLGLLDSPELDANEVQTSILQHLDDLNAKIYGHVGAPFIENVFSCVAKVIGKRSRQEELSIIINDGIFNSFGRLLIDDLFEVKNVKNLSNKVNKAEVKVDIFGSSGDDMDILIQNQLMDFDINENDWLFFPDMGAYSIGFDSNLVSVALPSKFGKFRIFTHDDEDLDMNRNDTEKEIKEQRLAIEDLSTSEVVEVIFLDVFGNYSEQQQQSTIDLFEELPGCDEADLWKEYLTNLH